MSLAACLNQIKSAPQTLEFNALIDVIDSHYNFTPREMQNGRVVNTPAQNQGATKVFAFGKLHGLSETQTLACFGHYLRDDVLKHPGGEDHQNIRNFIVHGWNGLVIKGDALRERSKPC